MNKNNNASSTPNAFVSAMCKIGHWFKSLFTVQDGKEPKLLTLYKKDATKSILSSIICILAGIFVGFLFMLILALISPDISVENAFSGLLIILEGPFGSKTQYGVTYFGDMIFYAAPLIMTGLSVAIAFKTGLFNIGAPGQFLMGTMGSLLVALNINAKGNPAMGFFVWLLALFVGMLLGALWGCIPGLFKALFGVNEVIVCIMTNWIAANIVTWVFSSDGLKHLVNTGAGKSSYLITTSKMGTGTPTFGLDDLFPGSYIDIGIFVAIIFAVVIYIVLNKTTFGFELKACGSNRNSAKYVGMSEKRNIILSMAIAGGLAAVGGALYYLNPGLEFNFKAVYQRLPDYGFNGISAALLANSNPFGVIFTGILLRYLAKGGENLTMVNFNKYIADIVIALIIYLAGLTKLIIGWLNKRQKKLDEKTQIKIAEAATSTAEETSDVAEAENTNTEEEEKN